MKVLEKIVVKNQKRTFTVNEEVIRCNNCQLNYTKNGFCQEFSSNIDNNNEEQIKNALTCKYWHPNTIPRNKFSADAPERERWYEKDSMG